MLNKLDPARRGMPWCLMTEDEQQLLWDAPIDTVTFLHLSALWKPVRAVGTCRRYVPYRVALDRLGTPQEDPGRDPCRA